MAIPKTCPPEADLCAEYSRTSLSGHALPDLGVMVRFAKEGQPRVGVQVDETGHTTRPVALIARAAGMPDASPRWMRTRSPSTKTVA